MAGGLRALGIDRGDRVGIRLPNGNDWALAFFGIQMLGAVAVPVNTRFTESEIEYVVTDSGASFVFEPGAPLPDGDPVVVDDLGHKDLAAIFYTSGTTGFPKGAMTTHENFLSNSETCRRVIGFTADDHIRNLISVPMFHVTGCNSQLIITIQMGGTTVIMPAFEVQAVPPRGRRRAHQRAHLGARHLLAGHEPAELPGLRRERACSGSRTAGPRPPPDVIERLLKSFPNARLGNGFGLTETSSVSTFLPHEYCRERPETVGFAAPVVELDLIEVDESSNVGELLIRGQNIVAGYWNKPEQTADTIVDGWLHTGDLARVDDDGFVQIVDRKKDMVNRGGENVYCVEVENALVQHPAVFEVAVMGVPGHDDGGEGRSGRGAPSRHQGRCEGDHRLRPRADRRLQGAAVHLVPSGAPAAQPRRKGAQGRAPQRDGVGRPDPLTRRCRGRAAQCAAGCAKHRLSSEARGAARSEAAAGAEIRRGPSTSRGRASARRSLRG